MAAEVPAKDVLCEAMEYLSKLGTNLRTRSENLKEKKIRREKLNNVLAVQRAASKVLLICELSKKSLENVETGVRKVLEFIDTSQASSSKGGKYSETEKDVTNQPKYYYFEYKTRKLRIKNRISFKHYNSVRVNAKILPKFMMDKYPVHYNCKLYRMRRKQKECQEAKAEDMKDFEEQSIQNDVSIISIPDTPISKTKAENNQDKNVNNGNDDISIISIPDSPGQNLDDTDKKFEKSHAETESRRKSSVESNKERSASRDEQSPKEKSDSSKKLRSREKRRSSDNKDDQRKPKRKRVISDSSSNDEKIADVGSRTKENVLAIKSDDSDVSCHESDSKKLKLNEESNDVMEPSEDENIAEKDANKNDDTVKPVIKCVSLCKLLKPDVLQKKKIIGPHSKPKDSSSKAKQKSKATQVEHSEKQARKEKEEEYWIRKRKEVSLFVSKKFVINVTRLPEMSLEYMNNLCLAKITQDGNTICEISSKKFDETDAGQKDEKGIGKSEKIIKNILTNDELKTNSRRASSNSSDDHDDALIAEANKVKNSLLNESDSDDLIGSDNELKSSKNTENIKNALLNDSDSETKKSDEGSKSGDQHKADKESASESEQAKTSLCKSDSESDKNEPKSTTAPVENDGADVADAETASIRLTYNPSDSDQDQDKTNSEKGAAATKTIPDRSRSEKDDESDDKNQNENDSDGSVKKNDENITKHVNEKTPEKGDTDKAKSSLLNDSSDDTTKTPLSQRLTPQSKKKRMRESIQAKKMLLTHSSSDTEDEQLKDALKDIKNSLLHGSDEDNKEKKQLEESSPSSSDEDVIKKVKKKITYDSRPSKEKRSKRKRKKYRRRLDRDDSASNTDNSKSSSSKMVRSKSKPGNSSSQNLDAPDSNDKDIDGLTNFNNLNKPRRRNSNSSKTSDSSASFEKAKEMSKSKIKPTGLISEEILKAESSSESAVASADENGDDEDVPEITLPSINGRGEHLVKEDLLGESDSSVSHNEDIQSVKEESGSEDKPNAKRRKANAISSDSEVGSSRKKDADVKISDFEDSDDSDINKRSRRKKKAVDSDASGGSNSSNEGGKKKRRRIKSVRESDASGSESETEGRNKHGRKNIRKVMGKNQLEEATKKAARQEKERMARIIERQKMYNNMEFDESGKPDEVVLDKVVLDFDPETKEPLIEVDRGLVKKLKPHQANGIKFMWDACFESVKRIKKDRGSGCILAHCMGLGKTLQVVSLTHTLLTHSDLTKVNRVLVVCPLSTVLNWVNEFRMWLKYAETEYDVEVFELSRYKQNSERAFQLSQWIRHGGVCVLGYEMFRNLSADNLKKFKKKMLKTFQEALVDPGPDMVVCDEGHLLKNEKTSLSQSMNKVKTYRRIVLTGTPLQNNLKEYYCMVQFVKPNLLGKYNEYLNRFVNPITNGQYTDSTEHDIKIMKRRSHVLHKMLDGAVQRRDYGVLAPFLPPKHEYVLFITLSEVQTKLYQHYLDNFSRKPSPGKSSGFLFPDFQSLQRIWTHPLVLKYNSERYEIMQQKKRDKEEEEEDLDSEGSLRNFIDDDSTSEDSSLEESTDDSSDVSDDSRKKNKKKKRAAKKAKKGKDKDMEGKGDGQSRPRRGTRANPVELGEEEEDVIESNIEVELKNENPTEWWVKLVSDEELDDMRNSHKLVLLFDILRQCETIGDKLLVFSQSLYSLDLIEHFLRKVDDATQEGRIDEKLGGHIGTWAQGVDYFRLDGSTSCENRSFWCKNFNREDNPRARLFLISTRAGGLGINLVAANRVVIFDVSWNPSHDVQSIFRVYRFGQKKPCYVYRFLAMGTMEEKIYERQVTKQAISKRVIDEQQIDRHYAENDLAELYKFEPKPPTPRSIPPLPKDRLFAEMLREHEAQIYKYHEHDSLLENKEEETLSEEERKAAWEDFENEKNKPPPAPFPNTWQMPNLLQQQQLAYAALASMLRKDMPNLSDNQLRDMLPLIYNSNPQLMQKLSEIYKYSPGMMNPAMMNPGVMNPAAGVGALGGMGGASGLQYEPPWQRQQQQQQQMRLQQMLQHQNQMGAKFYSGGLGSRDPVAMALQQQRAREIMLGNSAGAAASRPRGRPPMQPRAPPSGDVVNLDSD